MKNDKKNKAGWYGKCVFASVTFSLTQSDKISQPKDISDLCNELKMFVYKALYTNDKVPGWLYNTFEPDGDSYDQLTGTINIYFPSEIRISPENQAKYEQLLAKRNDLFAKWNGQLHEYSVGGASSNEIMRMESLLENRYRPIARELENQIRELRTYVTPKDFDYTSMKHAISQWMDDMELLDYEFVVDFNKIDQSRSRGGSVVRLNVTKNGSESFMRIPTMNLSNRNAALILNLLNYDHDYFEGQIEINQLLRDINSVNTFDIQNNEIPSKQDKNLIDQGVDANYIGDILKRLKDLCLFGLKHNFKYIQWG